MSPSAKKPLRDALRERFQEQRLDAVQLEALRARLDAAVASPAHGGPASPLTQPPARRRFLALAASVTAAGAVGYWGLFGLKAFRDTSNLQTLADEIAFNHLYEKPLDVVSASMVELRDAFAGVGFLLQEAPFQLPAAAELIGGRHCSIASVPAVMLRYRVGADVIGICQARFDPARHRGVPDMQVAAAPATAMARGLKVSLCHDRGVLMAMASA